MKIIFRANRKFAETIFLDASSSLGKGGASTTISNEIKNLKYFIKKLGITNATLFDIGANIGNYSLAAEKIEEISQIYAFEPNPSTFEALMRNTINSNKIRGQQIGFGNSNSKEKLFFDSELSGLASLNKRKLDHFNLIFDKSAVVQIFRLDDWINQYQVIPDLIKIDVEGTELQVLQGLKQQISKVKIIQFEFGGANLDSRTYLQDFFYFFDRINWNLFRITPSGIIEINKYKEEDEIFLTTNYLAINNKL